MKTQERNAGIDLLRVVCMLAIVIQHMMGYGWIVQVLNPNSWKYELAVALGTVSMFGLNCFALISGYVGVRARYRYSALAVQWMRVWFYSVLFTGIGVLVSPDSMSRMELVYAMFPVLKCEYWYFTAYVGCFMLVPFVKMAVLRMNEKQAAVSVTLLVLVFSGLGSNPMNDNTFFTNAGKGTLWLLVLYAIGAYIRVFEPHKRIPLPGLFALAVCAAALLAGYEPVGTRLGILLTGSKPSFIRATRDDSLRTLLMAVAMLMLFSRLRIAHGRKLIGALSAASFSVYLIHDHRVVRQYTISRYAVHLAGLELVPMLLGIVLAAAGIYLACTGIDLARRRLFDALRLRQRLDALEDRLLGDLWKE